MKNQNSIPNFWPNIIYLCIVFILLLLISNIVLILYGIGINKYVCTKAAQAGASVCARGGNEEDIEAAVFRTVNSSGISNFCISKPELGELRFYVKFDKGCRQQMLLVRTVTEIRVPAPFLLIVITPGQNGLIRFNSS